MPGAEDDVHWGNELKALPDWLRSLVVAIRLGGQVLVIVLLVAVLVGMSLGMFDDQASRDRRTILQLSVDELKQLQVNERLQREAQATMLQQSHLMEKHMATTEAISRNLCMLIPNLSDQERRVCVNGN